MLGSAGTQALQLHGTLIAYAGLGCLLIGDSGSGKSQLALESTLHGGRLVADDQVHLWMNTGMLMGSPAPQLKGVIEIRGVGLCRMPDSPTQQVLHVVVELLDPEKIERLPSALRTMQYHGVNVPYIQLPKVPYSNGLSLLAAIKAVHEGRILPPDWRPAV